MKEFVKSCDFLGFRPSLHVNEKKVFKTFFTGILSIFLGLLAFMTTLYFGSDLVFKSSSTIIKTSEPITSFGPYIFSNESYNVLVGMQDQNFKYYVDPTVFYVSGSMTVIKNVISNETGKIEQQFSFQSVNVDLCEKFYKDSDIIEKNMVFPLDKYYCPEPNAAIMQGYWGSELYQTFRISFNKCVNNTENKNHCKSQEEIDKAIQGAYVAFELTSYKVDQRDFSKPLQRIFADNYNLVNSKLSLEYAIGYLPLVMHSNDGLVLNNDNIYHGIDFHEKIFYKLNDGKGSFLSFTFEGTAFSTVYYRNYVKLQTIITQVGGFLKVISTIASIISHLISENYYFFFYFASIYPERNKNKTIKFKEIHIPLTKPGTNSETELNISPDIRNSKSQINHYTNYKNIISPSRKRLLTNGSQIIRESFKLNKEENSHPKKRRSLKIYVDSPQKLESRLFEFLYTKICFCKNRKSISTEINMAILAMYKLNTSVNRIMDNSFRLEEFAKKLDLKEFDLEENYPIWLEEKIRKQIKYNE
jgi:hypothetical protein